jgi:hypothetical protein
MLRVEFKILPKKRGFFLPQLIAQREYLKSDELKLNPHFVFKKEYQLPGVIYLTKSNEMKINSSYCKKITALVYEIDTYINEPYESHINKAINTKVCSSSSCSDCHAFLEWRPGAKPDYSDFVVVFEQVGRDMMEAWRKAVAEAEASGQNDEVDIVFSSDSYAIQKQEEEVRQRPLRKLKVD